MRANEVLVSLKKSIASIAQSVTYKAFGVEQPEVDGWEQAALWSNMFGGRGSLRPPGEITHDRREDARHYYPSHQRAEIALAAAQLWRGGDYWEFGSSPLSTMCNMLSAFDLNRLDQTYPDTRFYAFDLFGPGANSTSNEQSVAYSPEYFATYTRGDALAEHQAALEKHGLFVDRCTLVQGFFEDSLTAQRREDYLAQGRKIGFAFLDCNIMPSYKTVFEFLDGMLKPFSFVYMDEYFLQEVYLYWEQFRERLRDKHGIGTAYLRNAGSFGALFALHPLQTTAPPLEFAD